MKKRPSVLRHYLPKRIRIRILSVIPLLMIATHSTASSASLRASAFDGAEEIANRSEDEAVLVWDVPPACGSAEQVKKTIQDSLRNPQPIDDLEGVQILARIYGGKEGKKWTLDLEITSPFGSFARTLEDKSCQTLAKAAGVMAAVALDPIFVSEELSEQDSNDLEKMENPKDRRPSIIVGVESGIELGLIDLLAAAVATSIALQGRYYRVQLGGFYLSPRSIRPYPNQPDAGGDAQVGGISLRGCGRISTGRFDALSCGGLEAGAFRVTGVGLMENRTSHRLWSALLISQTFSWWLHPRWSIGVRVQGSFPFFRARFEVDDLGPLFTVGPTSVRVLLGGEWRIH